MPLREDILAPIAGENPSGIDLRYDTKLLIFDKIKEARREDDGLAQGDWQSARKTSNYALVAQLAADTLATVSKDLQLAAWLAEALLHTDGFGGLRQGLHLTDRLVTEFWDTIYPPIEDGDRELRARPLAWIGSMLDLAIRSAPLVAAGYSLLAYRESRVVGYEDQARTEKEKQARSAMLHQGKLAPEVFDKAFTDTPKAFYSCAEKDLDECLALVSRLEAFCDEKLEGDAPAYGKLRAALTDVRHAVHGFLEKKRESEPDPVEEPAAPEEMLEAGAAADPPGETGVGWMEGEPANRRQAIASLVAAATFLRHQEPFSPAPYLLLRAFRWGELRGASRLADSALLEAPPTETRQQIKRLALAKRWEELLEAGERAFALPGSRAWLDLQRLSVAACRALGSEYEAIAAAIESELRTLLHDLPELLGATLLDDTPAANPETRAWLEGLSAAPQPVASEEEQAGDAASGNGVPAWLAPAMDPYTLAKDALAAGREEKAFALMRAEVAKQSCGRRRFRRRMQMAELAIAAGKDSIAQPLLEDIAAAVETHKLDDWEDPEQLARDLTRLMRYSKRIQSNSSDKQKLFERICRLDPVQALSVE